MIRWNGELDAEIGRLRALALSWQHIADKMGFAGETIRHRAMNLGYSMDGLNRGAITGAKVQSGFAPKDRYKTHRSGWAEKRRASRQESRKRAKARP